MRHQIYTRLLTLSTLYLLNTSFIYCYNNKNRDNNTDNDAFAKFVDDLASKSKEAIEVVNWDQDLWSHLTNPSISNSIKESGKKANQLIESGAPGKLGFGFLMGYSSGYCLRRVSKIVAFLMGGIFISVQLLSYNGYLAVNFDKLQKDVENILDINKDGIVDADDAAAAYQQLQTIIGFHLPSGAGFATGLLAGLR